MHRPSCTMRTPRTSQPSTSNTPPLPTLQDHGHSYRLVYIPPQLPIEIDSADTPLQVTLQDSGGQRAPASRHSRTAHTGCLQMATTAESTSTATAGTCTPGAHTRKYPVACRASSGTALSGTWAMVLCSGVEWGMGIFVIIMHVMRSYCM